ncbi:c6 zinc finger protein [Fusarium langsethiae]|uniref:C6 zinc finger protein n=1 Tax=Fusarium langsethiae TaxID=179993 RepID=A0A0M9F0B6_FUSLA|nr:c6 zinc finger protein [Fusarium langsethiae]GKU01547.1 unnamed protein product [Fusarium langsethiae]GKU11250.1 unnamed protein product [Fusarium langsethiae]
MSTNTLRPHASSSSPPPFYSLSPYTLYSYTNKTPHSWDSSTMSSLNSFQQAVLNSSREDAFSGPEELSSNSNSPSSTAFTTDGRISPCGSVSAATEAGRLSVTSVPAACLACRSKHLKCDGVNPCSRCVTSGSDCVYVASRRGYKGPRRNTTQKVTKRPSPSPGRSRAPSRSGDSPMPLQSTHSPSLASTQSPPPLGTDSTFWTPYLVDNTWSSPLPTPFLDPTLATSSSMETDISFFQPYGTADPPNDMFNLFSSQQHESVSMQASISPFTERCIDYFYSHFHAAHPFVLPRETLLSIAHEAALEPVVAAMRWIGSLYIPACPHRGQLFQEAYRLVYKHDRRKDGFLVQALLLLLICLDGQGLQEKAQEILSKVERIAIEIGLNTISFANIHGRGMLVLEESWRRTWWELFVIDGLIAGIHKKTNFPLFDFMSDVALPCEEYQYLSEPLKDIPHPVYLEDVDDSGFYGLNCEFSSFTYRIRSAQILGKLLRNRPATGPCDENLSRIETLLTDWRRSLPQSKKDGLYHNGRLDEMMFQAYMIAHTTSILLHQPYSQLNLSSSQLADPSILHGSNDSLDAHTTYTIYSAAEISKLLTHRVSLLSHTHFLNYVVRMSSTVHLTKWALPLAPHEDSYNSTRRYIRLNNTVFSRMSLVWSAAEREGRSVKSMAQDIYQGKKQCQVMPQVWYGISHEAATKIIAEDEAVMQEFESI